MLSRLAFSLFLFKGLEEMNQNDEVELKIVCILLIAFSY